MYRLIDAPEEGFKVVHVDLEHLIEPAELIAALIVQLASDSIFSKITNGLSYFPRTVWTRFRANFEEVELLKVKIKLREQLRTDWQEKGEELFNLLAGIDTTIVFVLDEFPVMIDRMAKSDVHREGAKTLLRWLRRLRQAPGTTNIRFMIAGSIGIGQVLNELGEVAAINDFEQIRLHPFSKNVARELLDELSKAQDLEISDESKDKILECIGEPVPYFVQLMFSEIDKEHWLSEAEITPKLVEEIYHKRVLGVDCKTYFDHYYGRIREYYLPAEQKAVKLVLSQLAINGTMSREACYQIYRSSIGSESSLDSFNATMTNLENDFYIEFDQGANTFLFASKLLRDWWLRHYAMALDT